MIQTYAMASSNCCNRWNGRPGRQLTNFGSQSLLLSVGALWQEPRAGAGDPLIWY
jgi:hypothetical protein